MATVRCDGYELAEISLVGNDGKSRLAYRICSITANGKRYYVGRVAKTDDIAIAIERYMRWGIITET